jgi:hypothetical protein
MTRASTRFKQLTDFVRHTRAHRRDRSFFELAAFSVNAAAKQMVPPSTAAGIEADMRRGTLREIDGPGVSRDPTNASVHKATIPTKDPTVVHNHHFHRKDFIGSNRYAATKTANHGTNKGELVMQTIKARADATNILRLSDNTWWCISLNPTGLCAEQRKSGTGQRRSIASYRRELE